MYFILPNGIGDTIIMCCLHKSLSLKYGKKINYVIKANHEYILTLFGISEYVIEEFDREFLINVGRENDIPEEGKYYVAHPGFHNNGYLDKVFLSGQITFLEMYRQFFKLDRIEKLKMELKKPDISKELKLRLQQIGINDIGQTVLFAPEMNSGASYEILQPMWAKEYCNQLMKQQCVIYNTTKTEYGIGKHIELSIKDLFEIGANCKKVITSRSGISDLLYEYANEMHVIYPNIIFYELFSFEKMFSEINRNVYEYIISFADYFKKYNYNSVAIYGYGEGGRRICQSLMRENIDVVYAVDKNAHNIDADISVYSPYEQLPYVDLMIVCVKDKPEVIQRSFSYEFTGKICGMNQIMEEIVVPIF